MQRQSHPLRTGRGGARRRAGFSTLWMLLIAVGVLVAAATAWWLLRGTDQRAPRALTQVAERGRFLHEVAEQGQLESARNVEIRCQVRANGRAGTPILTIVPEGTYVNAGDLIAQLDSSALETEYTSRVIVANKSKAQMIQSKNVWDTAKISLTEYIEGTYLQERQRIQSEIFVAEEELRRAEQYLQYSEQLAAKGYVTSLQLEADRFAVDKARNELDSAQQRLEVLEKYTRPKQVTSLESDILTAEARYLADQNTYELDLQAAEELKEEIEKCRIVAPSAGQVVYANEFDRRGGAEVVIEEGAVLRQGQVFVRLPDPASMQVKASIGEARIGYIRPGMPVRVRVDAFPELALSGRVTRVNEYPEPGSWMSSNVRAYATWVSLDQSDVRLRPGLSAEVKIEVLDLEDELQLPVQAVYEHGGKHYAFLQQAERNWFARELHLGPSNNKTVVIRDGLVAGQVVAANPRVLLAHVALPEIPAAQRELLRRRAADPDAELLPPPNGTPRPESAGPLAEADRPRGQRPERAGGAAPDPAELIRRLDANGDGKLSQEELSGLPEPFRQRLLGMDSDGDGLLDAAELRAGMSSTEVAPPAGGEP